MDCCLVLHTFNWLIYVLSFHEGSIGLRRSARLQSKVQARRNMVFWSMWYTAWINFLIWSRRSDVWSKQISFSSKVGLFRWVERLLCWSCIWYMSAWVMGHMTFYPGIITGIEQLVDKSSWNQSECLLNVGWCCCVSVAKDDCMHIVRFLCAKCERNLETVLCSVLTETWGLIFTSYQFPWVNFRAQWFSWGEEAKLVQCTFELKICCNCLL